MSSTGERPYNDDDVNVTKPSLVRMVQRQQSKWPEQKFSPSRVDVKKLKETLLDPKNGFTTNEPLISSKLPPKTHHHDSAPPKQPPANSPEPEIPNLLVPPANPDTEVERVRVYIEDSRFYPVQKTVALLSLSVHVILTSYLVLLTHFAVDSSGIKISVPDSEDGWKIPFVRMVHGQFVEEMNFDPAALEITDNKRIHLFIDNVGITHPAPKAEETAVVLPAAGSSSSTNTVSHSTSTTAREDPAVTFLREKLSTRDGHQSFVAHRGRAVSNPEIVKDWQFSVNFKRDYNKTKVPMKIKLNHIQTALGIQSTWLTNAQTAVDIIATYSKVTEVEETLNRVDDPPKGSIALLNFLTEWKKQHPV
ncbi:hypothetical protein B0H16DRAFT_1738875 [Mycena metata]|uniref:Uncharacterized protein n=1 Tax=Mycena metata TaxID=1033252 RepID=A0AAD7HI19_9AGAR|nr:hypothetical protein B0H16DRAFT_1738875 [Mycena metata]